MALSPTEIPRIDTVGIVRRVLAFALVVTAGCRDIGVDVYYQHRVNRIRPVEQDPRRAACKTPSSVEFDLYHLSIPETAIEQPIPVRRPHWMFATARRERNSIALFRKPVYV